MQNHSFGTGLLVLSLFVSGCSSAPPPAPLAVIGEAETNSPFELRLLDEINDGEKLHIRGEVLSKKEDASRWNPVLARLTTVRQDGSRRSVYRRISFEIAKPTEIVLTAPILGVTDYQVELLWGAEAGSAAERALLDVVSAKLESQPIVCPTAPCPVTLLLNVDLENLGLKEITKATLGISLVGPDAVALAPEDVIEVSDLSILAGNHHNLEIEVASEVLPETAQKIYPQVRLINPEGVDSPAASS